MLLDFKNFLIFLNHLTDLIQNPKIFYCKLLDMRFHFYKNAYDMFNVDTNFHQVISMDDTMLQQKRPS